jgi:hypothetical protein
MMPPLMHPMLSQSRSNLDVPLHTGEIQEVIDFGGPMSYRHFTRKLAACIVLSNLMVLSIIRLVIHSACEMSDIRRA